MKKIIIKLFLSVIILISFTGCYTLLKTYSYGGYPVVNPRGYHEYRDYIYIRGYVINQLDENSPISSISLATASGKIEVKKIEILNDRIKIIYNGKTYYPEVWKDKTGVVLRDLNITGKFIAEFGEVRINNEKIIKMPPLYFEKYIKVIKYNPIADVLKSDTSKNIYWGPLEEYKKK